MCVYVTSKWSWRSSSWWWGWKKKMLFHTPHSLPYFLPFHFLLSPSPSSSLFLLSISSLFLFLSISFLFLLSLFQAKVNPTGSFDAVPFFKHSIFVPVVWIPIQWKEEGRKISNGKNFQEKNSEEKKFKWKETQCERNSKRKKSKLKKQPLGSKQRENIHEYFFPSLSLPLIEIVEEREGKKKKRMGKNMDRKIIINSNENRRSNKLKKKRRERRERKREKREGKGREKREKGKEKRKKEGEDWKPGKLTLICLTWDLVWFFRISIQFNSVFSWIREVEWSYRILHIS